MQLNLYKGFRPFILPGHGTFLTHLINNIRIGHLSVEKRSALYISEYSVFWTVDYVTHSKLSL
jgi:hypothetical protein